MMSRTKKLIWLSLIFVQALSACARQTGRLTQDQMLDTVWEALGPHTSTQNRDYWEVLEVRRVVGREVVDEFLVVYSGNCPGPALPESQPIKASSAYWYIKVAPTQKVVTLTQNAKTSTSESFAPEPLIYQAFFLIDLATGQIVARKLVCKE